MRLEDLDYDALIRQMWGSEENLKAFLDSETPQLCSWICGSDAPSPLAKVTYPPLKGELQDEVPKEAVANVVYQVGLNGDHPTIFIPAVIAGYREKLPRVIARELVHHWEALGAIGEDASEYPDFVNEIMARYRTKLPEEEFTDRFSAQFIAKAIKVARSFEVPLEEFLFPKIKLTVHMPQSETGSGESS